MESSTTHRDGLWARAGNLLASGWLIVSAFAWERGVPRTNAAVVGYLVFVLSLLATTFDGIRALNTALGAWLAISAWVLPGATLAMRCNTTALGAAIIALSLVSKGGGIRAPSLRGLRALVEPRAPRD